MKTKPESLRIYRYYNGIPLDVTTDKDLLKIDSIRGKKIVDTLNEVGCYLSRNVFYSLRSISGNGESTNV